MYCIQKVCFRGSCLERILRLITGGKILTDLKSLSFQFNAFVDDFIFIFFGCKRLDVELEAGSALSSFCQLLESLHLQLSPEKKTATTTLKAKNTKTLICYRVNGSSVHPVKYLLGLTLDKNLNWVEHIYNLKTKLLCYFELA